MSNEGRLKFRKKVGISELLLLAVGYKFAMIGSAGFIAQFAWLVLYIAKSRTSKGFDLIEDKNQK